MNSSKGNWSLYCLLCPMDNEVRYVGISTKPKRRLREHLTKKANNHKSNWLKKLKSKGLTPQLKVVKTNLTEDEAKVLELAFGLLFFLFGKKPLVNNLATLGGVPPSLKGRIVSKQTREKISKSKKLYYQKPENLKTLLGDNNPFYGKTHTVESRQKISKARIGKFMGEDNNFFGKTHSNETKRHLSEKARKRFAGKKGHQIARKLQANNMKPIKIWNEEQEYVFDSINEGARQLNLDLGALWRVLNKKQKTHKDYKACYLNL